MIKLYKAVQLRKRVIGGLTIALCSLINCLPIQYCISAKLYENCLTVCVDKIIAIFGPQCTALSSSNIKKKSIIIAYRVFLKFG